MGLEPASITFVSLEVHVEGQRQDGAEGHGGGATGAGKDDGGVRLDELGEHLAAGSAGRAGGMVEIGDGDGVNAEVGAELGDGADQGGALGADGEAVADVFDVGCGDDSAVVELEGRADFEAGVGRIGLARSLLRASEQGLERGIVFRRNVDGVLLRGGHEG